VRAQLRRTARNCIKLLGCNSSDVHVLQSPRSDALTERARRAARGDLGKLAIGVIESALYRVVPPVNRHFCTRFPEVEISVTDRQHPELAEEILFTEPLLAVIPDSHPLAAQREVSWVELCTQPLIMIPREINPPLRDRFIARCHQLALAPVISRKAWPQQTVVALVAAGLGLSSLPACMQRLGRPGVVYPPSPRPSSTPPARYRAAQGETGFQVEASDGEPFSGNCRRTPVPVVVWSYQLLRMRRRSSSGDLGTAV
jgi:DNA-binding transcriptional LysR family regulator